MEDFKFPLEVKQLALKGLYTLFESVDKKTLLARDSQNAFLFSKDGNYLKTLNVNEIKLSDYVRINLVKKDQVSNMLRSTEKIFE